MTSKFFSAALALAATTVSFAEVASAKTYEFTFSPIELQDESGLEQLNDRIADFARHACATGSPLHTHKMKRECREEMATQVWTQINAEQD